MAKRLVSVEATHTFVVRGVYVRSIHRQELTDEEIYSCIMQQTAVTEHLPNGTDRRLDLSNYKVKVEKPIEKKEEVKVTEHVAPVEEAKVEKTVEAKEAPATNNKKQNRFNKK